MNRSIKILFVLIAVFVTLALAFSILSLVVFVPELTSDKKECVTNSVLAHLPIRANLHFSGFPRGPVLNETVSFVYVLAPSVDLKVNVSEGIVLPEGFVFAENNLPTNRSTLSKDKRYQFNATIKAVKTGKWTIYASPGVYVDAYVFEDRKGVLRIQEVPFATQPAYIAQRIGNVSKEQQDALADTAKDWLSGYGAIDYEKEEFNCSILSLAWHPGYGCEMFGYSNSTLYDKYYFVIDEDLNTNKTKIRNVYRWAYQTSSGYHRKPVCEEITMKGGRNGE
ncbi:MAG: hypothetical protein U9Q37_01880 [Euryarchaeota archaeon]|nr:hypothetical protein [Euryarchaeota archaeon]